jgi:hypothetical protein
MRPGRLGSEIRIILLSERMAALHSSVVEFMHTVGKISMEIVEIIAMIILSRL